MSDSVEVPLVLARWYEYAKWVLERVENFPKSQRFVLGQRLSHQVMEVMELLVEASYSREKRHSLAAANRRMEVVRWTVRMCKDRNLLSAAQFVHSAKGLNECGRMVGWNNNENNLRSSNRNNNTPTNENNNVGFRIARPPNLLRGPAARSS